MPRWIPASLLVLALGASCFLTLAVAAQEASTESDTKRRHHHHHRHRDADAESGADTAKGSTDGDSANADKAAAAEAGTRQSGGGKAAASSSDASAKSARKGSTARAGSAQRASEFDFSTATPDQLNAFAAQAEAQREKLQAGKRCEAFRMASRVPYRTYMVKEHERHAYVAGGLFLFALVLGFAWESNSMRSLMPIAPLVGAVYLGYAVVTDTQSMLDTIHGGLRACSTEFPEIEGSEAEKVALRIKWVKQMEREIDRVYGANHQLVERTLAASR